MWNLFRLRRRPRPCVSARLSYRPRLESLEERALLTGVLDTWTNAGGNGLWSNPGNWDHGVVPGAGDTAHFSSTYRQACAVDPANVTIEALEIDQGYNQNINLAFAQGGTTLNIVGTGTQYTPQTYQYSGTISGGTIFIKLTNYDWYGGTQPGTGDTTPLIIDETGQLTIHTDSSSNQVLNGRTLDNYGVVHWTGMGSGWLVLSGSADINNFTNADNTPARFSMQVFQNNHLYGQQTATGFINKGWLSKDLPSSSYAPPDTTYLDLLLTTPSQSQIYDNFGTLQYSYAPLYNYGYIKLYAVGMKVPQGYVQSGSATLVVWGSQSTSLSTSSFTQSGGSVSAIQQQYAINVSGDYNLNAGTIYVGNNGGIYIGGSAYFTGSNSVTTLDYGGINVAKVFELENGLITSRSPGAIMVANGSGTLIIYASAELAIQGEIYGNVDNQGLLDAGSDYMFGLALTISGNYTAESNSVTQVNLGGPGEYNMLHISGTANLEPGSIFKLNDTTGYVPKRGDSFSVMYYNGLNGAFTTLLLPPAQGTWVAVYQPPPGSFTLYVY